MPPVEVAALPEFAFAGHRDQPSLSIRSQRDVAFGHFSRSIGRPGKIRRRADKLDCSVLADGIAAMTSPNPVP